jgi:pyridoxine 4-dehydrogenase
MLHQSRDVAGALFPKNVTSGQVALAWLLRHNPVMLPIPGTLRVTHLKENVAAAALSLTPEDMDLLDSALE